MIQLLRNYELRIPLPDFDCGKPRLNESLAHLLDLAAAGELQTDVLIYLVQERVAGFAHLSIIPETRLMAIGPDGKLREHLVEGASIGVEELAVCASYQGQGLGEALLFASLQYGWVMNGARYAFLEAPYADTRGFYLRYGFKPVVEAGDLLSLNISRFFPT